ncbi:MAG: TlpA disulfide reductase family protein [Pseudomonadota bacterium]
MSKPVISDRATDPSAPSADGLTAIDALFESGNVAAWVNTRGQRLARADVAGKIVVVEAFQMLCPGCVLHGLPQAARLAQQFPAAELAVLGLHTVFEHHDVQGTEAALAAFLGEYRYTFPVAIDARDAGERLPRLMRRWQLEGTPSLLVFDQVGRLVDRSFGHVDDLRLGVVLGGLLAAPAENTTASTAAARCDDAGCRV